MTASTPQSHKPPAKAWLRQVRLNRMGALFFLALGLVLLAANLNLLPAAAQQALGWSWPVLLLASGLWLLLAGRAFGRAEPTFALEREHYTAGELALNTGLADLQLQGLPNADHLALGHLPAPLSPTVTVADDSVRLRLAGRTALALLNNPAWSLALAPDLPWSLLAQSSLGDLKLDLQNVTLSAAKLRSSFGHVDLTLPARGQADLEVRLGLGDLTVRVPEGMAVRITVTRGRLATLVPDARRFVELAPGEWATPLFAVSPARCTLHVHLWSGELTLM